MTARVRAVFLWHLHQPEYRDPQTGQPLLPWVRLTCSPLYHPILPLLIDSDAPRRAMPPVQLPPPGGEETAALGSGGEPCGRGRAGTIAELSLELAALGLAPQDKAGLLVRVLQDWAEQERLPRYGDLPLSVPGAGFDQLNWQV